MPVQAIPRDMGFTLFLDVGIGAALMRAMVDKCCESDYIESSCLPLLKLFAGSLRMQDSFKHQFLLFQE